MNNNPKLYSKEIYKKNSNFLFNHFYDMIYAMVFKNVKSNKFKLPNAKRLEGKIKRYIEDLTNMPCRGLCINIYYDTDIKIVISSGHKEASYILYMIDLESYHNMNLRKQKIEEIFADDRSACKLD